VRASTWSRTPPKKDEPPLIVNVCAENEDSAPRTYAALS
jgi:hypothetical protein